MKMGFNLSGLSFCKQLLDSRVQASTGMGVLAPRSPQPSPSRGWHEEENDENGISARVGGLRSNRSEIIHFLSWPWQEGNPQFRTLALRKHEEIYFHCCPAMAGWLYPSFTQAKLRHSEIRVILGPFNMIVHVAIPLAQRTLSNIFATFVWSYWLQIQPCMLIFSKKCYLAPKQQEKCSHFCKKRSPLQNLDWMGIANEVFSYS